VNRKIIFELLGELNAIRVELGLPPEEPDFIGAIRELKRQAAARADAPVGGPIEGTPLPPDTDFQQNDPRGWPNTPARREPGDKRP
jgi:hypothetical protein